MKRLSGTLLLVILFTSEFLAQEDRKPVIRFVFYNVENFFDTSDDTLRSDNDFLPDGVMNWNRLRYKVKINSIYKVLSAAGEWDLPAIVGFYEVEKRSVLQDLVSETYLNRYNYGIIHEESEDPRGIDVCSIYRRDLVRLHSFKYLKPEDLQEEDFKTRKVLYLKMLILNDTIHLFLNHWPSRRGGTLAEETLRNRIAMMVKSKSDSISASVNNQAKIIVAGDFNCAPGDNVITTLTGKGRRERTDNKADLINLSETSAKRGIGTYKYMGAWEMIDQVLVSEYLLKCTEGLFSDSGSFRVFNPEFLLIRDPVYPGLIPFSTYRGYRYQGGFSDHLPVVLDLRKR